jgi:uncharacterized membrane protein
MKIKEPLKKISRKLYFTPLLYGLAFIALSFITIHVDATQIAFLNRNSDFLTQLFLVLIGGLLTMLTITFSTMMVVLTLYSNQLSPRTLQDFLNNRTTKHVLGFFIGGLAYSITSLYLAKQYNDFDSLIPFIGVLIFIVSLALFAYFIHFVAKEVQVNHYVQRIEMKIDAMIDGALETSIDFEGIKDNELDNLELDKKDKQTIKAESSGYVTNFDVEKLLKYAIDHHTLIETKPFLGSYVSKGDVLLNVYSPSINEQDYKTLFGLVVIEDEPSQDEDIDNNIKKITEVALKALSPGINDPETAIFCISRIAYLLHKEARIIETRKYENNNDIKLIYSNKSFDQALFTHFIQIIQYGGHDIQVFISVIKALTRIAKGHHYEIRIALNSFLEHMLSSSAYQSFTTYEIEILNKHIKTFEDTVGMNVQNIRKSINS